ncbi:alpha/beta-hydrolase [Ramaria rubella]|nr:alpha/beta-hydrolase [Ramaria rubella]
MVAGVLLVVADPGSNVTLDEFHDWYNNEHGPDRMRLSGINSGLRYEATDGLSPPWLATYELDDIAFLQEPVYTQLRANRSPREVHVISRMAVLDRRIYRLIESQGRFNAESKSVAVTVGLVVPSNLSSALEEWYAKEHIGMLSHIPGWLRSRLLLEVSPEKPLGFTRYLAIHEYTESNELGGSAHKAAMSTTWRTRVMLGLQSSPQRRVYRLHRIFSAVPNDLDHLPLDKPRVIDSFCPLEDGIKIHYRLEGSPSGPIIAFCNSLLTDLHIWDHIVPKLTSRYQILRYDARGHGLSTSGSLQPNIEDLSSDLLSLVMALNISYIHAVIGVSLGGVTAIQFALSNPSRVSRLVVADCNIASSSGNTTAWEERISLARSSESGLAELAHLTLARWFLPSSLQPQYSEAVQAVQNMILSTSLTGFEHGVRALCDFDLRGKLSTLQVPAMFVVGEKDGVLPNVMESFYSTVQDSRFAVINESGHLPMVEAPIAFWNVVSLFLDDIE